MFLNVLGRIMYVVKRGVWYDALSHPSYINSPSFIPQIEVSLNYIFVLHETA